MDAAHSGTAVPSSLKNEHAAPDGAAAAVTEDPFGLDQLIDTEPGCATDQLDNFLLSQISLEKYHAPRDVEALTLAHLHILMCTRCQPFPSKVDVSSCRQQERPVYDASKLAWNADEAMAMRRQAILDCASSLKPMCKLAWAKTAAILVLDNVTKRQGVWCEAQKVDVQDLVKFLQARQSCTGKVRHMPMVLRTRQLSYCHRNLEPSLALIYHCEACHVSAVCWNPSLVIICRRRLKSRLEEISTPLKPQRSSGRAKQSARVAKLVLVARASRSIGWGS
jgi:hypothetical protein